MADKEKLSMVDLVGIGNLLESLVAADHITCEDTLGYVIQSWLRSRNTLAF